MSFEAVDADIKVERPVQNPRDEELLGELYSIIRNEWPHYTREKIDSIYPGTGASTLIIQWDWDDDSVDETLLGGYPSALLKHGWAICGQKNKMTFVAPIRESMEDDVEFRFEAETGEVNDMYCPKPCDVCGEREFVEYIDVEAEVEGFERRLENDEYIPRHWVRHLKLCDECDLPDEYTEYERDEPDFDPSDYPDYNFFGSGSGEDSDDE